MSLTNQRLGSTSTVFIWRNKEASSYPFQQTGSLGARGINDANLFRGGSSSTL